MRAVTVGELRTLLEALRDDEADIVLVVGRTASFVERVETNVEGPWPQSRPEVWLFGGDPRA